MISSIVAAVISALNSSKYGDPDKYFAGGFMMAVDHAPPFTIEFINQPKYSENFNADYSTTGYPGGRFKNPVFKGCSAHEISFTLRYDLARQNRVANSGITQSIEGLKDSSGFASNPLYNTDAVDTGDDSSIRFKGTNKIANTILKASQTDYLSRIKACIETLKMPKGGSSLTLQAMSGKVLQVSQGSSDPAPPLVLLCRNPNRFYLGYLAQGDIKELNYDTNMFCTRMEIDCKFIVAPDTILTTFADVLRQINVIASVSI